MLARLPTLGTLVHPCSWFGLLSRDRGLIVISVVAFSPEYSRMFKKREKDRNHPPQAAQFSCARRAARLLPWNVPSKWRHSSHTPKTGTYLVWVGFQSCFFFSPSNLPISMEMCNTSRNECASTINDVHLFNSRLSACIACRSIGGFPPAANLPRLACIIISAARRIPESARIGPPPPPPHTNRISRGKCARRNRRCYPLWPLNRWPVRSGWLCVCQRALSGGCARQ